MLRLPGSVEKALDKPEFDKWYKTLDKRLIAHFSVEKNVQSFKEYMFENEPEMINHTFMYDMPLDKFFECMFILFSVEIVKDRYPVKGDTALEILLSPLEDMPLLINNRLRHGKSVVDYRLKIGA